MRTSTSAPAAASSSELLTGGRRPNTILPGQFFKLTDDNISAMSDESLRLFLDETQGVRLATGTPRSVLLSRLQSVAIAARDI